MDLKTLIEAWQLAPKVQELGQPASAEAIAAAERTLSFTLPAELRALYLFSDGAGLVGGNLSYYPLRARDGISLEASSAQLRQWKWPIPEEVLVFGGNGCGEQFGLWMPVSAAPQLPRSPRTTPAPTIAATTWKPCARFLRNEGSRRMTPPHAC